MSACTIIRVASAQPCPLLDMHIPTPSAQAMSRSASGSSTLPDFPPSSSTTWRIPLAARSMMRWPTPGEPVKCNMSTRGSPVRASPAIALSSELIMLTTPGGTSVDSAMKCALDLLEAMPPELVVGAPRRLVGDPTCGGYRVIDVVGAGVRSSAHDGFVGRIDDVVSLAGLGLAELAVDEQSAFVGGLGHVC